jgi:opacity protein-like surface antigen
MFKAKIVLLFVLTLLLTVTLASSDVRAQDEELGQLDDLDESFDSIDGAEADDLNLDDMIEESQAKRHPYLLAISGSAYHMIPINVLKEEVYDINDLTGAGFGFGFGAKIFILDGFALSAEYRRASMDFVDDRPGEMAPINAMLLSGTPDLSPESGLRMDSLALGFTAYIGDKVMPDSKFNMYFAGQLLFTDWAVTDNGRDGEILNFDNELLEGTDMGVGFGLGTEFALTSKIMLDTSLIWNYVLTGDELRFDGFESSNLSQYWTNTHWLGLSVGLVIGL